MKGFTIRCHECGTQVNCEPRKEREKGIWLGYDRITEMSSIVCKCGNEVVEQDKWSGSIEEGELKELWE